MIDTTTTAALAERLAEELATVDPITVTTRCSGLGRRYEAAISSALTRRAESWTVDQDGVWTNCHGQWSARAYAVRLNGVNAGTIAVSSASDDTDFTVFRLLVEDAENLASRLIEVDAYQTATWHRRSEDGDPVTVLDEDEIHGDDLLWRGLPLDPNGRDRRRYRACRSGRGVCPECEEHQGAGHRLIWIKTLDGRRGRRFQTRPQVRPFSDRRFSLQITIEPGTGMDGVLAAAGLRLAQTPVHDAAHVEIVDQAALDAALAEPDAEPEPVPEVEQQPSIDAPLADWERELLEGLRADS